MSDHTANGGLGSVGHRPVRVPKSEFRVYFWLIFLVALPVGFVTWAFTLIADRRLPRLGPFARAFYDAKAITPMIFSA